MYCKILEDGSEKDKYVRNSLDEVRPGDEKGKGQVYDMKKGNNKNTIINYIPFYVLGARSGERGRLA